MRREHGVESFCPRIRFTKRTRRGPVKFVEALFPCYLFVHTDLKETYRRIMAATGVTGVVRYGDRVPRVPEAFVEQLRARLDGDLHEEPEPPLEQGQTVTLLEGPFKDWQAVVSGLIPGRERVAILLEFLGQTLELRVPAHAVLREGDNARGRTYKPIE
ncbi:MAG: transcription termination/antitermination protein NusG [Opitutales bacterium]